MFCIVLSFIHIFVEQSTMLNMLPLKTIKMKQKKSILFIATFIWFATTAFSKAPKFYNEKWEDSFKKEIGFPTFLIDKGEKTESVNILYKIDEMGKMEIISISTNNRELKKYVWEKIKSKNFVCPNEPINTISKMKIVFNYN